MNIPSQITTLLVGILLTVVSLWYGQNHGLLPVAASKEAPLIDGLFNFMMTIGTGLFLIVQGVLIFSAFKFRRRPGDDTDGPPVEGNIPLEILWTAIPAVLVLGIAVYSFEIYNLIGGLNPMEHSPMAHGASTQQVATIPGAAIAAEMPDTATSAPLADASEAPSENRNQEVKDATAQDPATNAVRDESIPALKDAPERGVSSPRIGPTPDRQGIPPDFVVNATGLQYAWIFTYPDSGITSGELHLPVGREVLLNISANDVLHAFWVPEYRLKQDAIPGRQTELRFTPSIVGEYPVICAELCGPYHGAMKTKVVAETPADFDAWVESQKVASSEGLDTAVALSAAEKSPAEFLAPFVSNLGIDTAIDVKATQVNAIRHAHTAAHHP